MKQSASNVQYYIQPPDIPEFLYKTSHKAWQDLMVWAYKEYRRRLTYLSRGGNYLELTRQSNEFSPIRILAELSGFRRYCAEMRDHWANTGSCAWNKMDKKEQHFIVAAYEMRELLFRDS